MSKQAVTSLRLCHVARAHCHVRRLQHAAGAQWVPRVHDAVVAQKTRSGRSARFFTWMPRRLGRSAPLQGYKIRVCHEVDAAALRQKAHELEGVGAVALKAVAWLCVPSRSGSPAAITKKARDCGRRSLPQWMSTACRASARRLCLTDSDFISWCARSGHALTTRPRLARLHELDPPGKSIPPAEGDDLHVRPVPDLLLTRAGLEARNWVGDVRGARARPGPPPRRSSCRLVMISRSSCLFFALDQIWISKKRLDSFHRGSPAVRVVPRCTGFSIKRATRPAVFSVDLRPPVLDAPSRCAIRAPSRPGVHGPFPGAVPHERSTCNVPILQICPCERVKDLALPRDANALPTPEGSIATTGSSLSSGLLLIPAGVAQNADAILPLLPPIP